MAEISQRELERFFAEIAPRLETAQTLDDELDRQLARRFNVFRYLRTDEKGFSRMIADLLDPAGAHGQGAIFLKLLTDKLEFAQDLNSSDLSNAKVQMERQIVGRRRIDIVVEIDSTHCLAIENKSNSAADSKRQVADDLDWLVEGYSHSLLVYLSPTGDGPSEDSVARETIKGLRTATPRRFVIMSCDSSSETSDDGFDELRSKFSLVDWLADCRRNCDVDRLRWYLREIETYCRQRYGGNKVTDSKKSTVADFVRGDSKNVATAMAVYVVWPEVAREIKSKFLDLVEQRVGDMLKGRLPDICWDWSYGEKRGERSYIGIYRECWRPYVVDGGQEEHTTIYMQAEAPNLTNWDIGVWSPASSRVSRDDRERSEKLHKEIGSLAESLRKKQNSEWPWWEWIDEKYRHWDSLIPKLHEEVAKDSGEITDYFVQKFKQIADESIPIIDRIDGGS